MDVRRARSLSTRIPSLDLCRYQIQDSAGSVWQSAHCATTSTRPTQDIASRSRPLLRALGALQPRDWLSPSPMITHGNKKDQKGRRIRIGALAFSLAAGRNGTDGPIGLFQAEHGASVIIGAAAKGRQARHEMQKQHQVVTMIAAKLRCLLGRRLFARQRWAARWVQTAYRCNLKPRLKRGKDEWRKAVLEAARAFTTAVDAHDLNTMKSLCHEDISLHVELPTYSFDEQGQVHA